ncbi:MAG: BNR-4 repeat-containing protein [Phycisphaeraceae bacterium]
MPESLEGFFGLWYCNQRLDGPYRYKYSGGLGTYPQQHAPIAIHRPEVKRTYFAFGTAHTRGEKLGEHELIDAVAYFNHDTGLLHRPVQVMKRNLLDAHENPVLCIDDLGHLLVFCPGHGSKRTSYLWRSRNPHDLDSFELVREWPVGDNFSYPQPWWTEAHGLVFLHTRYDERKRRLAVTTSPDGTDWSAWSEPVWLSHMASGDYQVSWIGADGTVATAFDVHPDGKDIPLNYRTNFYYAQSRDGGRTWQTASGETLDLPLRDVHNPALVLDAEARGELVYLKDIGFDDAQRPWVMYVTSRGFMPGPEQGPYQWWLARYRDDGTWSHHPITTSDHNYDHGSLHWLGDNDLRLVAPTDPGDEPAATGGLMCMWQSTDGGETWRKLARLLDDPKNTHTYARRPRDASPDFAWMWADGRVYEPSSSRLYFADIDGRVFRMPESFDGPTVAPEPVSEQAV